MTTQKSVPFSKTAPINNGNSKDDYLYSKRINHFFGLNKTILKQLNDSFKDGTITFNEYFRSLVAHSDNAIFAKKINKLVSSEEKSYLKFLDIILDFKTIKRNNYVFNDEILIKTLLNTIPGEPYLLHKLNTVINVLCYSDSKEARKLYLSLAPLFQFLSENSFLQKEELETLLLYKNIHSL